MSLGFLVFSLWRSVSFAGWEEDFVVRCYRQYLCREPESQAVITSWANEVRAQGPRAASDGIRKSKEGQYRFVNQCYLQLLGRLPESQEALDFWGEAFRRDGYEAVRTDIERHRDDALKKQQKKQEAKVSEEPRERPLPQFRGRRGCRSEGHVGEIRYSILTRDQFRALYGEEWDLMQGQSLERDSELFSLWGKEQLPDARGMFLRCANEGRDRGTGNPEGDLGVGMSQKDTFSSHQHHTEFVASEFNQAYTLESYAPRPPVSIFQGLMLECPTPDTPLSILQPTHLPPNAKRGTTMEGGLETRPRCLIVNVFIKLRESLEEEREEERGWLQSAEFREAVERVIRERMFRRTRSCAENCVREDNGILEIDDSDEDLEGEEISVGCS